MHAAGRRYRGNFLKTRKSALRQSLIARRDGLDGATVAASSEEVCTLLLDLVEPNQHVALYHAFRNEVALEGFARSYKGNIYYPRVEGSGLAFAQVDAATTFRQGFAGILEPEGDALSPQILEWVLVPGVAFSMSGQRLGFGKGFYDRFLPQTSDDCVHIGIAYDWQIFQDLPVEKHDCMMHKIVTPERVIHL